jgi:hypothetical protein
MPWSPLKEALASLFAAGEPDHRQDDGHAIDAQHHERRDLNRRRHVESEFGEPERAYDRNQKYQPHCKHNRK